MSVSVWTNCRPPPRVVPRMQDAAHPLLAKNCAKLNRLQEIFYASQQHALLIVLQGMDTAGKDGTIRHIFSGINPQGCEVTAFKTPTPLELRHDFLWRAHLAVPPRGHDRHLQPVALRGSAVPACARQITARTPAPAWKTSTRSRGSLSDNNVVILKFFLHISHEEQTRRLQSRLDDPDKHWKLSAADFAERKFWPRLPGRVRGSAVEDQPQACALVCHPRRPQMAGAPRYLGRPGRSDAESQAEVPEA